MFKVLKPTLCSFEFIKNCRFRLFKYFKIRKSLDSVVWKNQNQRTAGSILEDLTS